MTILTITINYNFEGTQIILLFFSNQIGNNHFKNLEFFKLWNQLFNQTIISSFHFIYTLFKTLICIISTEKKIHVHQNFARLRYIWPVMLLWYIRVLSLRRPLSDCMPVGCQSTLKLVLNFCALKLYTVACNSNQQSCSSDTDKLQYSLDFHELQGRYQILFSFLFGNKI